MAMDEHSLLQCFNLELPVQTDNSIEQDFLWHEKEIIYHAVVNVIYEHEESQQNSQEIEWSKTLGAMSTFTINEIERHRQLSGKILGFPITKTRKFKEHFFPQGR